MEIQESSRCPVCRAQFRGTRQCSRCGADLSALMVLSVKAQRHRIKARKSLLALNFEKAQDLAAAAQKAHATEAGRKLLLLTAWLNAEL
jgi:hypothetical protein